MPLKLLHLSDLHIGNNYFDGYEDFVTEVEAALYNDVEGIEAVVVTGDIFDANEFKRRDYKSLIKEAVNTFEYLMERLNEGVNSNLEKTDIIFVPGNHELDENESSSDELVFDRYKEFLESFYSDGIPDNYNLYNYSVFKDYKDHKIAFLGFNSVCFHDANSERFGLIKARQMVDLIRNIDELPNKDEYSVVALLHHHIYFVQERDRDYKDLSVLRNSREFMKKLSRFNVSAILHGHKHETMNHRLNLNTKINEKDQITNILGCGATGKSDTAYNSFNYIEIYSLEEPHELTYAAYNYVSDAFERQQIIKLPINKARPEKIELFDHFLSYGGEMAKEYKDFKNTEDSGYSDSLIEMLGKTIGTLEGTSAQIYEDYRIVFYLLIAMHYRYAILDNDQYIDKLEEFALKYLSREFDGDKRSKLFELLKLKSFFDASEHYNALYLRCTDKERRYLTFLMMSYLVCEQYIVLKRKSGEFFKARIEGKVNLDLNKEAIRNGIQGATLKCEANEERRSIEVEVCCPGAEAHKAVTLIVKEFELEIQKYEENFVEYNFKIYYNVPKIKTTKDTTLSSYNFEAYVPKLIPLLAGENLYMRPEVFARELIQNSIDAIGLRKEHYGMEEEGQINIILGEEDGRQYFEITDNGTGMNQYKLERYFTSIGRSFYSSKDFDDLQSNYKPISKFGIGFLSCFLVGKQIEVYTKHCEKGSVGYKLDIPNLDGCFFIEEKPDINIGTKIRVYEGEKPGKFNTNDIIQYILNTIQNPKVKININNGQYTIRKGSFIENIVEDTKKNKLIFVIPLDTDGAIINIDMKEYLDNKEYISNPYGIFYYKRDSQLYWQQHIIYNCEGIEVNGYKINRNLKLNEYFDIYVNLPNSIITIDVAREHISWSEKYYDYVIENKLIDKIQNSLSKIYLTSLININKTSYFILHQLNPKTYNYNLSININFNKILIDNNSIKSTDDIINNIYHNNFLSFLDIDSYNFEKKIFNYEINENDHRGNFDKYKNGSPFNRSNLSKIISETIRNIIKNHPNKINKESIKLDFVEPWYIKDFSLKFISIYFLYLMNRGREEERDEKYLLCGIYYTIVYCSCFFTLEDLEKGFELDLSIALTEDLPSSSLG